MCWVALDRAIRLANGAGLVGDVAGWAIERDAIRDAILEHGFSRELGAFTQTLDGNALDASVLMMPLVGFLPSDDPRMRATVDRIRERLTEHGLVRRYLAGDHLPGCEGTFAICSFWLVDNLALQGRIDEATALFEHVTSYANDVGLMTEQIDPTSGTLLGNYPQGFTHLALIRSALLLANARGVRDAKPAVAAMTARAQSQVLSPPQ